MQNIAFENVSATLHHGEKVSLTDHWQDNNVLCPNSKLFYIIDGEIVIETKYQTFTAKAGDMVLISAGTKHNYHLSTLKKASKYWLHFDMTVKGNNLFDYYSLPFKVYIGQNEYVSNLFERALKLKDSPNIFDKLSVSSALFSLLAFYAERCDYKSDNTVGDEIDRTVNFIKNNYQEKLTLDQLCLKANLSKGYFVRKFKERTGLSPMQYVSVLKVDKAKTLIEQSSAPISSVMEQVGFLDSAHFSKLFKSRTGYSPKKFREINGYRKANKSV